MGSITIIASVDRCKFLSLVPVSFWPSGAYSRSRRAVKAFSENPLTFFFVLFSRFCFRPQMEKARLERAAEKNENYVRRCLPGPIPTNQLRVVFRRRHKKKNSEKKTCCVGNIERASHAKIPRIPSIDNPNKIAKTLPFQPCNALRYL